MNRLSKKMPIIIYAQEELPKRINKSIFLAGPTSRKNGITEWRKKAIKILIDNHYDGVVFIPEIRTGIFNNKYQEQIDWEKKMMNLSDCILFWIDRNYSEGLTTNIEFGKYMHSEKLVVGFPKDSPKNTYIQKECKKLNISYTFNLEDTIKNAIDFVKDGVLRVGGERYVPSIIYNTSMFQNWYKAQKNVGNELRSAKINYVFKMPIMKQLFLYVLHVQVYIKSEDRIKDNEFVLSRTDISSIVIYRKDKENLLNSDIVLIKEFRSPCCNSKAFVYEICGGSSFKDNDDINEVIKDEIKEETGLEFDKDRIVYEGSRQLMATLSSHKCHLFSVEISEDELENIRKQEDSTHGVKEDTELTYLKILKLKDILNSDLADWSNIGYIMSVLNK